MYCIFIYVLAISLLLLFWSVATDVAYFGVKYWADWGFSS